MAAQAGVSLTRLPRKLSNTFRKLWKAGGYPNNSSSGVLPPPPNDCKRLYHLTSVEHALSNIVRHRLKIARFSALNDPFELLAHDSIDKDVRKLLIQHKNELEAKSGLLCFSADWKN